MPLSVMPALSWFLLLSQASAITINVRSRSEAGVSWDPEIDEDDSVHFAEEVVPLRLGATHRQSQRGTIDPQTLENNVSVSDSLRNLLWSNDSQSAASNGVSSMCQGCDITIDMRCKGQRCRHAFFHRVTDCLLPTYGLLTKAREVKGQTCILTWSNAHEVNILPLLSLLADDLNPRIISEDEPCVEGMDYWSAQPHYNHGAKREYVEEWQSLPHIAGRVALDADAFMRAFIADADRHLGHWQRPRLVLVTRRSGERSFTRDSEDELSSMLARVVVSTGTGKHLDRQPWKKRKVDLQTDLYLGEESMLQTMKIFGNAAGVVGYHGAGFVNTLFAGHPVCVEEITTYMDTNTSQIWRSNDQLAGMNRFLVWEKYLIAVQRLIESNWAQQAWNAAPDKNQFIKRFRHIVLSAAYVRQLGAQLTGCLSKNVLRP